MSAVISRLSTAVAVLVLLVSTARAATLPAALVSTDWLQEHRGEVTVLDVRGGMDAGTMAAGTIPGAVLVPFMNVRATAEEDGVALQDMHLPQSAFESLLRGAGVNDGDAVVITHPGGELADWASASYLYWQMKYYGIESVALLDGGTAKWARDNRPLAAAAMVKPGNVTVRTVNRSLLATTRDTRAALDAGSADVVDARPMSQVLGIDKRDYVAAYGHIPGAKVLPLDALIPMGKGSPLWNREALARGVAGAGLTPDRPVIVYCNTGHMATVDWFVLHELLGFRDVALFDGSMHAWTKQGLPVTTSIR